MARISIIPRVFMGIVVIFVSCISYAKTKVLPLKIPCAPSVEMAGWNTIPGNHHAQLILTTLGVETKLPTGRTELVTSRWRLEYELMHTGNTVLVVAKCMLSGIEVANMFPHAVPPGGGPTLVCPKGDGLSIRFTSPNDPDPLRYFYKGNITVIEDETPREPMTTAVRVDGGTSIDPAKTGGGLGSGAPTTSSSGMGTGGKVPTEGPVQSLASVNSMSITQYNTSACTKCK